VGFYRLIKDFGYGIFQYSTFAIQFDFTVSPLHCPLKKKARKITAAQYKAKRIQDNDTPVQSQSER
jgi:hypothetical protein